MLGLFDNAGNISSTRRFETPKTYKEFLSKFEEEYKNFYEPITKVAVAAPGRLDKKNDTVIAFGNLPWKNTPLKDDIKKITRKPTSVENDAKLAALSESIIYSDKYDKVLYVTFSTGIGAGLIYKGALEESMLDSEAGQMVLPNPDNNNKLEKWEDFASGRALYSKYGKKAADIDDKKTWTDFSSKMAIGLVELSAVIEPDLIIIGGGVGTHFKKYADALIKNTHEMLPKMVKKPLIKGAANAELASLLGCYYYSRSKNG